MIFFPWEGNDPVKCTRPLIEETDRAATVFLSGAEHLKVVGYSFHEYNRERFERLLANARNCRVIDLFDPSEEAHLRLESLAAKLRLEAKILWHKQGWQP